ncbi:hypothetical protein DRO66_02330 [Candidatus Bathyarchaeota archaeon]|nr:MAG: hypothetical protein DRO66_02330 [Candidatus Bathyarchaeota archaeon]
MAKNTTFIDDLIKKMPQPAQQIDPNTEFTFPTLGQQGQAGAAQFNASAPDTFDPLQFFGDRATSPQASTPVAPESPFAPNPALETMTPDFARQMNVPSDIITQPNAVQPQAASVEPPVDFSAPRAAVATPESVAPLAPEATTEAGPQAPIAPISTGGMITRDSTGESFIGGSSTPATPDQVDQFEKDSAGQRAEFEERTAEKNPQINPADVSAANAARGRPINVSTSEVEVAQQQAKDRDLNSAADLAAREFRKSVSLDGGSISEREEKIAEFRADFMEGKKDGRTPEKVKSERLAVEAKELEVERRKKAIEKGNQPNATGFQKKQGEWEERAEDLRSAGMSQGEIDARRRSFLHGDTFDPFDFQGEGDDSGPPDGIPPASAHNGVTLDTPSGKYKSDGTKWTKV